MQKRLREVERSISLKKPLVHNITNFVTANDCANIELAFGGRPVMADAVGEVEEVTACADSLVVNLGTLDERKIESIRLAVGCANEKGIPVILDPVGCGFTSMRRAFSKELISDFQLSVVRGNLSEIIALLSNDANGRGVDISESDAMAGIDQIKRYALTLAEQLACVVVVSGEDDIVTDGRQTAVLKNGNKLMSMIAGTGCMQSAMLGVSVGANPEDIFAASFYAVSSMGLAGEKGASYINENGLGTASLRNAIIDNVSKSSADMIIREAVYHVE